MHIPFRRPQFVAVATFLMSLCQGFMFYSIPLVAKEDMKVSPAMLGYYGFVPSLFVLAGSWLGGRWSDRFGRRKILTLSMVLPMSGIILFFFCRSEYSYFIPAILYWGTIAMYWPAIEGAMSDGQTSRQIKRASGVFSSSWMLGLVIGPITAGWLYKQNHYLPFAACLVILAVVFLLLNLPRSLEIAPWCSGRKLEHEENVSYSRRSLLLQLAFIGNMTTYFMLSALRALLPEYATPRGITGIEYGLLQASTVLGMVLTIWLLMVWHRWHYSLPWLIATQVLAVAALLWFSFTDSYGLMLFLGFILGFPAGVTYYSSIYYGMEISENKGAHGGNHETIIAVGKVTGPLLGGWAIAWSGFPKACFLLSALVFVGCIAAQVLIARRRLAGERAVVLRSDRHSGTLAD